MAASRTVCRYARSLLATSDMAARRLFVGAPIRRCPAPARHVVSVLYLSDVFLYYRQVLAACADGCIAFTVQRGAVPHSADSSLYCSGQARQSNPHAALTRLLRPSPPPPPSLPFPLPPFPPYPPSYWSSHPFAPPSHSRHTTYTIAVAVLNGLRGGAFAYTLQSGEAPLRRNDLSLSRSSQACAPTRHLNYVPPVPRKTPPPL